MGERQLVERRDARWKMAGRRGRRPRRCALPCGAWRSRKPQPRRLFSWCSQHGRAVRSARRTTAGRRHGARVRHGVAFTTLSFDDRLLDKTGDSCRGHADADCPASGQCVFRPRVGMTSELAPMTIADNVRNADRVRRPRSPGRYVVVSTRCHPLGDAGGGEHPVGPQMDSTGLRASIDSRRIDDVRTSDNPRIRDHSTTASEIRTMESRERPTATSAAHRIGAVVEILDAFDDALFASPRENPRWVARPASTERRAGRAITRDTATMFRAVRRWTRPATNASRRRLARRRLSPRTARRPQPGQERASPAMRGSRRPSNARHRRVGDRSRGRANDRAAERARQAVAESSQRRRDRRAPLDRRSSTPSSSSSPGTGQPEHRTGRGRAPEDAAAGAVSPCPAATSRCCRPEPDRSWRTAPGHFWRASPCSQDGFQAFSVRGVVDGLQRGVGAKHEGTQEHLAEPHADL